MWFDVNTVDYRSTAVESKDHTTWHDIVYANKGEHLPAFYRETIPLKDISTVVDNYVVIDMSKTAGGSEWDVVEIEGNVECFLRCNDKKLWPIKRIITVACIHTNKTLYVDVTKQDTGVIHLIKYVFTTELRKAIMNSPGPIRLQDGSIRYMDGMMVGGQPNSLDASESADDNTPA